MIRSAEAEQTVGGEFCGYFRRRWRGDTSLGRLVIRDTLLAGTMINLLTGILALLLLSSGAPAWFAMLIFLLPLPYNIFLFGCIWRLSGRVGGWKGTLSAAIGALWLIAATII